MFYVLCSNYLIRSITFYVSQRDIRKINKTNTTKGSYMIFNVLEIMINR